MQKILIADKIDSSGIAYLRKQHAEVLYEPDISPDKLGGKIADVHAVIVRSRTRVTAAVIDAGKNLQVIARAGVGVDNIDVSYAHQKEIVVVNTPGSNSQTVAEHTFALLLALSRNLFKPAMAMREGRWEKKGHQAWELSNKTLGIVGFGRIGMRVAEIARSFGMNIAVHNRTTSGMKKDLLERLQGKFVSMEQLLVTADIVTLHVAQTSTTKKLITRVELAQMKPSAYLINCSRGDVVDEEALVTALAEKKIVGAALDVYSVEPLTDESPFCKLDNVLLTPHIAAVSTEAAQRAAIMVAEDVMRVLCGEQAENAV